MVPNQAQIRFEKEKTNRDIILKARQLGFSTYCLIDLLDDVIFNANFTAAIVADRMENVKKLFRIIKLAVDKFPLPFLEIESESMDEIRFKNGSNIYVALSVRSGMVNRLHVSELAKMSRDFPIRAEEVITGSFEAVPKEGSITVESTPEGVGGYFYDLWQRAPQNGFAKHFFAWFEDSDYKTDLPIEVPPEFHEIKKRYNLTDLQISWYYLKSQTLKEKLQQEYACEPELAFLQSGRPVFDMNEIKRCVPEEPKANHKYGAGLDTAVGSGTDWSALTIIDKQTGCQVFTYCSQEPIPVFAKKAAEACIRYNNALLNIEVNGVGIAMKNAVEAQYDNLYYQQQDYNQRTHSYTAKVGTVTTRQNKAIMINDVKALLRTSLKISDEKTYIEMLSFQYDENDTMSAPAGSNDDCVMALALAVRTLPEIVVQSDESSTLEYNASINNLINSLNSE